MSNPAAYHWTEDLGDAACITVVTGSNVHDVLQGFGADTSTTLEGDDTYGGGDPYPASVAAVEVPGGVVAVELNGYQGSLSEVLVRLSSSGAAASIYWNVNDDNAFTCARSGQFVASADMYDAEDPDEVDLPDEVTELFELAGDDEADMWAVGLAMVEKFTGVAVPRDAMGRLTTHPIRQAG